MTFKWAESFFSAYPRIHIIWDNWAKEPFRSGQELLEIVYGQFQEEFQQRALFLLLVPNALLVPFKWGHPIQIPYLGTKLDFEKVEVGLRSHAIYWLTKFIDYTKYQLSDSNFQPVLLDAYNNYILQLLAVLPPEDNQAETLFQYFSIKDPTASKTDINGFGYKPLLALWENQQINEKWKRLADSEIRQVIKKELCGESTPRESWENALRCYAEHLQSLLPSDPRFLPYSKEFLADQIDFLISLEVSDLRLIRPESVALILALFKEAKYNELWHRFIRFIVLRDGNFKIYSEQTEEAARLILRECDTQVHHVIQTQLNTYRQAEHKLKEEAEEMQRKKEALLAPMRKITLVFPKDYSDQD